MKRYGGIYPRISSRENLSLAFIKAAKGKKLRKEVIAWREDFDLNITRLACQLESGKLDVGHYRFFTVHDPKQREICAASFGERVMHHALMNVCEPAFENYQVYDSYACRTGKGQYKALERTKYFCGKYCWYLKLDIRRYFDSINHAVLLNILERRFREKRVISLFEQIFSSYATSKGCGLPIGNLVSQHCANLYLAVLDHKVKDELGIKGYLRYMDDFVLFGREKRELASLLRELRIFLCTVLRLELKDNIQLNRSSFGLPFLGYRVYPHSFRLNRYSRERFAAKMKLYQWRYRAGIWDEEELTNHVQPLIAFTQFADAKGFRREVLRRIGEVF